MENKCYQDNMSRLLYMQPCHWAMRPGRYYYFRDNNSGRNAEWSLCETYNIDPKVSKQGHVICLRECYAFHKMNPYVLLSHCRWDTTVTWDTGQHVIIISFYEPNSVRTIKSCNLGLSRSSNDRCYKVEMVHLWIRINRIRVYNQVVRELSDPHAMHYCCICTSLSAHICVVWGIYCKEMAEKGKAWAKLWISCLSMWVGAEK